jgi:hypothetical protein
MLDTREVLQRRIVTGDRQSEADADIIDIEIELLNAAVRWLWRHHDGSMMQDRAGVEDLLEELRAKFRP